MPLGPLIQPFLTRLGLFIAGGLARAPALGTGGQALTAGLKAVGVGMVGAGLGATTAMVMAPRLRPEITALPTETIAIAPGALPQIVKTWQAGAALFAMDNTGQRWVWIVRQFRWKRIRNTRNIVISGKDMRRARKIISASKRLNDMRTRLSRRSSK